MRANEWTRKIEDDLKLFSNGNNLVVSVVTIGEIKSIAIQNKWGKRRIEQMLKTLNEFLVSDIKTNKILEKYAEIDAYSQGRLERLKGNFTSKNMGKNDLWIAATAAVLDIELLTTDKDFEHLNESFLKLRMINLNDYK